MINKKIIEKCLISVTDQLAIIKEARKILINLGNGECLLSFRGLCAILKNCIHNLSEKETWYEYMLTEEHIHLVDYFPMFTLENARQFNTFNCKSEFEYWWELCPYDYENRIKFLDWMEKDILK